MSEFDSQRGFRSIVSVGKLAPRVRSVNIPPRKLGIGGVGSDGGGGINTDVTTPPPSVIDRVAG